MRALRLLRRVWRSLPVGRLFGVPIQVHTTWLLFPLGPTLWACVSDRDGRSVAFEVAFVGMLVFSLFCHEFAHVLVARKFGCGTRRVLLIPFGCIADLDGIPVHPVEFWMAMAGPLASFALSGVAWLGSQACLQASHTYLWLLVYKTLQGMALLNLMLGSFNLLPCFPMDGGRMLRSLLAVATSLFSRQRGHAAFLQATRIAVRWVAWPLGSLATAGAVLYYQDWFSPVMFGLLLLAGEAEFWVLRKAFESVAKGFQGYFMPLTPEMIDALVAGQEMEEQPGDLAEVGMESLAGMDRGGEKVVKTA